MQSRDAASEPAAGGGPTVDGSPLSRAQFAARFVDSWPALRSIAAGVLGHPAHAEDVVQEAALIALGKLESFESGTSFTAWMGQIVRFVALNSARRSSRRRTAPVDPKTFEEVPDRDARSQRIELDVHGSFGEGREQFDGRVLRALAALDETSRVCLLLRVLHDLPYREISRILSIPEGTAMSYVHRSRRTLYERLAVDAASPGRSEGDS